MPEYTVAAVAAAVAVVLADRFHWHSRLVRNRAWQLTMAICLFFMVLTNGWLTKLSAPIVIYASAERTPWRFPLDIPVEDYFYGFALLHWVLCRWVVLGRTGEAGQPSAERATTASFRQVGTRARAEKTS